MAKNLRFRQAMQPAKSEVGRACDRRLDDALRDLPRERAGDGFTAGVLQRVEASKATRSRWRSLTAAAVVLAALGVGAGEWSERMEQEAAAERIASLRAEYELLREELEDLQKAADTQRHVVYLGGNEDLDYVLDLSRLTAAAGADRSGWEGPSS